MRRRIGIDELRRTVAREDVFSRHTLLCRKSGTEGGAVRVGIAVGALQRGNAGVEHRPAHAEGADVDGKIVFGARVAAVFILRKTHR